MVKNESWLGKWLVSRIMLKDGFTNCEVAEILQKQPKTKKVVKTQNG